MISIDSFTETFSIKDSRATISMACLIFNGTIKYNDSYV